MWLALAGAVLALLKYFEIDPVAQWSWWYVWAPFGGAALWWAYSDASGLTAKRQMDRLDKRKEDRRRKNFEAMGMDYKLVRKAGASEGYREVRKAQALEREGPRDAKRRENEDTLARGSTQFGSSELEPTAVSKDTRG